MFNINERHDCFSMESNNTSSETEMADDKVNNMNYRIQLSSIDNAQSSVSQIPASKPNINGNSTNINKETIIALQNTSENMPSSSIVDSNDCKYPIEKENDITPWPRSISAPEIGRPKRSVSDMAEETDKVIKCASR